MSREDSWVDRTALPTLRHLPYQFQYLIDSLNDADPSQAKAKIELIEARHRIKAAIVALEVQ